MLLYLTWEKVSNKPGYGINITLFKHKVQINITVPGRCQRWVIKQLYQLQGNPLSTDKYSHHSHFDEYWKIVVQNADQNIRAIHHQYKLQITFKWLQINIYYARHNGWFLEICTKFKPPYEISQQMKLNFKIILLKHRM